MTASSEVRSTLDKQNAGDRSRKVGHEIIIVVPFGENVHDTMSVIDEFLIIRVHTGL